jgi:hypothetical protein
VFASRCGVHATNLNPSPIPSTLFVRSPASTIHPHLLPATPLPKNHDPCRTIPFRVAPRRRLHCPSRTHRLARLSVLPNPAAPPPLPRSCATPPTHPTRPDQGLALIVSSGCLGSRSCLSGPFVPFSPSPSPRPAAGCLLACPCNAVAVGRVRHGAGDAVQSISGLELLYIAAAAAAAAGLRERLPTSAVAARANMIADFP